MPRRMLNPFIYGKPVPTGRFVGRQDEVRTVFSRLYNGESTAIVGEPHIGKTSLLNYIADESTRREWIAQVFARYAFADFDCHLIGADWTPDDFWQQVLLRVAEQIENEAVRQQCQAVAEKGYSAFELESLFRLIGRREYRVALLIDEFDTLLDHPAFGQAEFLAALRSLATRTDGLALIIASRLGVAQMNRKSQYRSPSGSPFFNHMIEVRLPHLSHDEAQGLIVDTLQAVHDGVTFKAADFALAYSLAGRHPFLLQIAGASLFDAIAAGPASSRPALRTQAEDLFHQRAAAHFDDYWRTLDEPDQRTLLILAMLEQASLVQHRPLEPQQLGALPWFEADLRRLTGLYAVESDERGARLAVGGLRRWAVENIVSGQRYAADFSTWLHDKGRQNLLSKPEIARLVELAGQLLSAEQPELPALAQLREDLHLVEERKSQFIQETDIPLQLVKDERRIREQIKDLEDRLRRLK